jgi:hypothetical protein
VSVALNFFLYEINYLMDEHFAMSTVTKLTVHMLPEKKINLIVRCIIPNVLQLFSET